MVTNYKRTLIGSDTPFAIVEAFKEIRTNLLYTARDEKCPVYAITSAMANAGKSVVASNLALTFSQLGKRVLLIDCDMRNPSQHKIFGLDRSFGLSELAAGISSDFDTAIHRVPGQEFDVILSGHIPPNPAELLASANFENLLKQLKERYDCIFLDFPPAGVVVDSLIQASLFTGYAFVVRSGMDDRRATAATLAAMKKVGANILGFILNDVNPKTSSYYGKHRNYRYRYKYRYRYDYSYGATPKQVETEASDNQ